MGELCLCGCGMKQLWVYKVSSLSLFSSLSFFIHQFLKFLKSRAEDLFCFSSGLGIDVVHLVFFFFFFFNLEI